MSQNLLLDKATLADIRTRSRRTAARDGLDMIVVDYLQLVTPLSCRGSSRQEDVAAISRNLKLLAKELAVPVIALASAPGNYPGPGPASPPGVGCSGC